MKCSSRLRVAGGATEEEAAQAAFAAAREQAAAEGASPEEIAAAEQAYNDALAAGASPEEALQAAGDAAGQLNPDGDPDGSGGDLPPGVSQESVEQAATAVYQQALADGATPEEAMIAANNAADDTVMAALGGDPDAPGGFGDDPNSPGGFGDPNAPGGLSGDPNAPGGFSGDPNASGDFGGGSFGGGGDFFGGGDSFGGGGDSFFGGGDVFGGDPFLSGGSGNDIFNDYNANNNDALDFSFTETGDNYFFLDVGGPDTNTDDNNSSNNNTTTNTFQEAINATTGPNPNLKGGTGNTQFIMTQGSTLGGSDVITDLGGTDEIAFRNMDNLLGIFEGGGGVGPHTITYSNYNGGVFGDVTITDIDQLYANDGVASYVNANDTSGTSAKTGTNGVRLDISGADDGKFGYIIAGTTGNDDGTSNPVITLAHGTALNYGSGKATNTVDSSLILGSIIFGKSGDDTITGSAKGDVIFGGSGNDILNGGGTDSYDGDIIIGGTGDDTFNMDTSSLANSAIVGGSGTDIVNYNGYGASVSFAVTATSVTATHNSTVNDSLNSVEDLRGVTAIANDFSFIGDTTLQGLITITGGAQGDTFTLGIGANVNTVLQGGSADTAQDTYVFKSGVTFSGAIGQFETGTDKITFFGMSGVDYATSAYSYQGTVSTTVSDIVANGSSDTVYFFTDSTDGYIYVNGAGSGSSHDTLLIEMTGFTTPVAATDLQGINNSAPVLTTATYGTATNEDTGITITEASFLANASDPEGHTMNVNTVTSGNGNVVDNGNSTWTFTPSANYNGTAALSYTVADQLGASAMEVLP